MTTTRLIVGFVLLAGLAVVLLYLFGTNLVGGFSPSGSSNASGDRVGYRDPARETYIVPFEEVLSGGPPPDGIPAIDEPKFITIKEADRLLGDKEPVIVFSVGREGRAYPLRIMTWHEIVNDEVAGTPVSITFCPLCNSAIAFDRRFDGRLFDFGTSGKLYRSDLVMYDRQTSSLWSQIDGQAIAGPLAGEHLTKLPATIASWTGFKETFPNGKVLSQDTGFSRPYGTNPYPGYDSVDTGPFLFRGETDGRLAAMERVVAIEINDESAAFPFEQLASEAGRVSGGERAAVHDALGGQPVVVFFEKGTASALDSRALAQGRDIGATGVFIPRVEDRALTFDVDGKGFVDRETGSQWNLFGQATGGPLNGQNLEPVQHIDTFWFAWAAFSDDIRIWMP